MGSMLSVYDQNVNKNQLIQIGNRMFKHQLRREISQITKSFQWNWYQNYILRQVVSFEWISKLYINRIFNLFDKYFKCIFGQIYAIKKFEISKCNCFSTLSYKNLMRKEAPTMIETQQHVFGKLREVLILISASLFDSFEDR